MNIVGTARGSLDNLAQFLHGSFRVSVDLNGRPCHSVTGIFIGGLCLIDGKIPRELKTARFLSSVINSTGLARRHETVVVLDSDSRFEVEDLPISRKHKRLCKFVLACSNASVRRGIASDFVEREFIESYSYGGAEAILYKNNSCYTISVYKAHGVRDWQFEVAGGVLSKYIDELYRDNGLCLEIEVEPSPFNPMNVFPLPLCAFIVNELKTSSASLRAVDDVLSEGSDESKLPLFSELRRLWLNSLDFSRCFLFVHQNKERLVAELKGISFRCEG